MAGHWIPSVYSKDKLCPLRSFGPTDFFRRGGIGGSQAGPLCPFLPKRRDRAAWPYLGPSTQGSSHGWGSVSQTGIGSKWPQGALSLSLERRSWGHLCPGGGAHNFPPFKGFTHTSVPQGFWRAVSLISFWVLDSHQPLEQSQPPSPHPSPIPSTLLGLTQGSLNISLPEMARVCQFIGLAGGALSCITGDA